MPLGADSMRTRVFCSWAMIRSTAAFSSATMTTLMPAVAMNRSSETSSGLTSSRLKAGGTKRYQAVTADKTVANTPGQNPPRRAAMTMAG